MSTDEAESAKNQRHINRRHMLGAGGLAAIAVAAPVNSALAQIGPIAPCTHVITLSNVAAATTARKIRIRNGTPGTRILSSVVPGGWAAIGSYTTSVIWHLVSGAPIPAGTPIPGQFSIRIQNNPTPNKHVFVEWLTATNVVLCSQKLLVPCGDRVPRRIDELNLTPRGEVNRPRLQEFRTEAGAVAAGAMGVPGMVGGAQSPVSDLDRCRCFGAETDADPDSQMFAEPDISVDLGEPVAAGLLKVMVPYTIELEPASLSHTRSWLVTSIDDEDVEQPISVPFTDNMTGQATFTLPGPGQYEFSLTVVDPASCVSDAYRDNHELSDSDQASYVTDETVSVILIEENTDACDPRKVRFKDASEPLGVHRVWSIKDGFGAEIASSEGGAGITTLGDSNGVVSFQAPTLGTTYTVCLNADDPAGSVRPEVCKAFTPAAQPVSVDFKPDYDSCPDAGPSGPFDVKFLNKSSANGCPVTWHWDFGHDNEQSEDEEPTHTYPPGSYPVTLTMKDSSTGQITTATNTINVYWWMPDVTYVDCGDGHVKFSTNAPCNPDEDNLYRCQRMWDFNPENDQPTVVWRESKRRKEKIWVCYPDPGTYKYKLEAENADGGHCRKANRIVISSVLWARKKDRDRLESEFDYNGKRYQLVTKFKFSGGGFKRITAKSKLKIKKGIGFFRKRAYKITAQITGKVMRRDSNGCFATEYAIQQLPESRENKAKVTQRHNAGNQRFRVRQNGLRSYHTVQIDANHTPVSVSMEMAKNYHVC